MLEDDVPLNVIRCLIYLCDLSVIQVDWHSRLCLRNLFPSLQISFQILSNPVKYQAIAIFQILREIAFEKNCFGEHSSLQSLIAFHLLSKYYFTFPHKNTVQHLFLEKVHKCCSIGDERKTSCERFVAFPSSNIKYKDKSAGAALEITFYWLFISSQDKITSSKQIYHSTGPVLLLQQMKIFFCKKNIKSLLVGW